MKKRHIVFCIILVFATYSLCTISGAMKLQAFFMTLDPSVYVDNVVESIFGVPYYDFEDSHADKETGNSLGVFTCERHGLLVTVSYTGMP